MMVDRQLYKSPFHADAAYTHLSLNEDDGAVKLEQALGAVQGQNYAFQLVKEYLFGNLNRRNEKGPAALLVFAGAPAVGKTFMAEQIAKALGRPFDRIDMSGYADKEAHFSLAGINPSYKGAASGRLTSFLYENPVSVVQLDEVEKAHPVVKNLLLQMLERGSIRDLYMDQEISVRDAIIIITTNVGREIYESGRRDFQLSQTPLSVITDAFEHEIDPETNAPYFSRALVSRFASGRIVIFNKLRPQTLMQIALQEMEKQSEYYQKQYALSFTADKEKLAMLLILTQGGAADARAVKRCVREFFEKHLERVVTYTGEADRSFAFSSMHVEIDLAHATDRAQALLRGNQPRLLVHGRDALRYTRAENSVETIEATEDFDLKSIPTLDVSAAIIEADEGGDRLFEALAKQGIPLYCYTTKKEGHSFFLPYTDRGAVDCFSPAFTNTTLKKWVSGIVSGMTLQETMRSAFRANRVAEFEASYEIDRVNQCVRLQIGEIDFQTAYAGRDMADFVEGIPNVRLDDVFGAGDAKKELLPMIRQLKHAKRYLRQGIRLPRGIILSGAPGTGKTMLARAIACEAEMAFIQKNATEFLQQYVGEGPRSVRELFATARKYAPSIIFIDEIDAIARARTGNPDHHAIEELVNTFLAEMDGFDAHDDAPVFVIAATNFTTRRGETTLDEAFLRRFDRKIHMDLPDKKTREAFLTATLAKYSFSKVTSSFLANLASRSVGWTLSDLNLIVQNSIRHAEDAKSGAFCLTDQILNEAFECYDAGLSKHLTEQEVEKTAYHEAGHAVISALLGRMPAYVTIVSRDNAAGYVMLGESENAAFRSRRECEDDICIALAGRASERLFFGEDGITSGASSDLQRATETAKRMICLYGMSECVTPSVQPDRWMEFPVVWEQVTQLLTRQGERVDALVKQSRDVIGRVADALLERNSLDKAALEKIIAKEE